MLTDFFLKLASSLAGINSEQLAKIEGVLPATKQLVEISIKAQPLIIQLEALFKEATPLIDQATNEWKTVGPVVEMMIGIIEKDTSSSGNSIEGTVNNIVKNLKW